MDQTALAARFRKVILANELDNNLAFALKFSDPDGVRSGKSGWSFGVCQYDIANNPAAATCLRACGFTVEEIAGLKAQTVDVKALEPKLKAAAATVEKFDTIQLNGCITRAQAILSRRNIQPADDAALLAIADYANQYYLSDIDKPGYGRAFRAADILSWKLEHTPYGKSRPSDCQRRYDNLVRIMEAA
jgi:hypothetical protein